MKRVRFSELFLFVAVLVFIASGRNIYSSVFLMLASAYMLIDVVPKLWRRWNDAKR